MVTRRGRWQRLCARGARWVPLGGPSTSPLDVMKTPLLITVVLVAAVVLAIALLRTRVVKPVRVTAAEFPRILAAVSASTRTPTFAAFVFTTPDQQNPKDAVNLQFSLENGRAGFDWVLLAPRNIKDKDSFVEYLRLRGYSYSERKMNGVAYLRIEGGDLAQLCSDVVTRLYARPRDEPMDMIVEGFEWSS